MSEEREKEKEKEKRDQKVVYNSRSQIYNKQNKNDTKKEKCIVLFVPGAKWNQKDRKEWNWNWNGSSFILPIMRQENSFVAHKRQK